VKFLAALIILIQLIALALIIGLLWDMKAQSALLPEKIDMLVDHSQDQPIINLDCPECPQCPESKDYTKELEEIKKAIKSNGNQAGVYYYYSGCQGNMR
jgi:hypothetical protein